MNNQIMDELHMLMRKLKLSMKASISIEKYHYLGFHGKYCYCNINIWPDLNLVIMKHIPGQLPSPQQMIEGIPNQVLSKYPLKIQKMIWVDYIPAFCHAHYNKDDQIFSVSLDTVRPIWGNSNEVVGSSAKFTSINKRTLEDFLDGKIEIKSQHQIKYKFGA